MTREEARTALGDRNILLFGMSKEERKYYSEALDMAISALPTEGEYIKKSELMDHVCYCADWNMDLYYVDKDDIEKMQTYSFPGSAKAETAKPEEWVIDFSNIKDAELESIKAEIHELDVEDLIFYEGTHKLCHSEFICKDDVMAIIDKHIKTETWNGYHGTITAPKGTFDRIYEECKDSEDDI